ncbi:MAG: hypothetical protein WD278_20180, partial [Pirellulales bacterium]
MRYVPAGRFRQVFAACVLALCACPAWAEEAADAGPERLPDGMKVVRIEAFPPAIELEHPYDYRQLLLTGELESGERIDVTRLVEAELPEGLVTMTPTALVRPAADGGGELRFSLAGQTLAVSVTVKGQTEKHPVSFVRDVQPALSKMGCNAGTCHGSANGKNGFKLSLRGYDPLFDHRELTDDLAARRFNRAAPDQSLMLLKPAGGVPHVGGVVTR